MPTIRRDPIHDHSQPCPRSPATLSTITRDPIHDHPRPYPRSPATLSTITRDPAHDHPRPYPRSPATLPTITRDHAYEEKIADDREGNEVIFGARERVKYWEGSGFTDEDVTFCLL